MDGCPRNENKARIEATVLQRGWDSLKRYSGNVEPINL